jgi:hypothetical protein
MMGSKKDTINNDGYHRPIARSRREEDTPQQKQLWFASVWAAQKSMTVDFNNADTKADNLLENGSKNLNEKNVLRG